MTKLRAALANPTPWIIGAYFLFVVLGVVTVLLYTRTVKTQAAHEAAIARCLASRPQLERISTHLRGVNLLADVLVTNNKAALAATPSSDPQMAARKANLKRIEQARADIAAVQSLPVPTVRQCKRAQPY